MIFPKESHSEVRLRKEFEFAQMHYASTEVLSDTRIRLADFYFTHHNWPAAGQLLLEDLAFRLQERPASCRVWDSVRRLFPLERVYSEALKRAVSMLEERVRSEEWMSMKGKAMSWLGSLHEKMSELERAEEKYAEAGREELIVFYTRNDLYAKAEKLLYEDYSAGDLSSLPKLDLFYKRIISRIPKDLWCFLTPHSPAIQRLEQYTALPLLRLTHRKSLSLPKTHLPPLAHLLHQLSERLNKADRIDSCAARISTLCGLMTHLALLFGLSPEELVLSYIRKSLFHAKLCAECMTERVLQYMAEWRGGQRETVQWYLVVAARSEDKPEKVERMVWRTPRKSQWNPMYLRQAYT